VGYDELGLASCCGFGGPRGGAMEATAVDILSVVEQASVVVQVAERKEVILRGLRERENGR
jgi:hypothetical protein